MAVSSFLFLDYNPPIAGFDHDAGDFHPWESVFNDACDLAENPHSLAFGEPSVEDAAYHIENTLEECNRAGVRLPPVVEKYLLLFVEEANGLGYGALNSVYTFIHLQAFEWCILLANEIISTGSIFNGRNKAKMASHALKKAADLGVKLPDDVSERLNTFIKAVGV